MTIEEHRRLIYLNDERVTYAYFCGAPEDTIWKDPQSFRKILVDNECQKTS